MKEILDMLKMPFTGMAVEKDNDKQLPRKEKVCPRGYEYR